jgi:hypothetical protein
MELTPYVEMVRRDLSAAADAASDQVRDAADRLSYAVEPSLRMAMFEALGVAAADVTSQLEGTVVEVRLRGREPEFVVTEHVAPPPAPPVPPVPPPPPEPPSGPDVDEGLARISLRLPESLKTRLEPAAAEAGQSTNAWVVRTLTQVLEGKFAEASTTQHVRGPVGQRLTGWQR